MQIGRFQTHLQTLASAAAKGADRVTQHLKAEGFGRGNRDQPAQLLAAFFAQTAAVMAAWEAGTIRYRCTIAIILSIDM